jgi:hypothetical protein
MSQLSKMIEDLKEKISQVEQSIATAVSNHAVLLGQGQALKHMLDVATGLAEEVLPGNPVVEGLEVVDKIVDNVTTDNLLPTENP